MTVDAGHASWTRGCEPQSAPVARLCDPELRAAPVAPPHSSGLSGEEGRQYELRRTGPSRKRGSKPLLLSSAARRTEPVALRRPREGPQSVSVSEASEPPSVCSNSSAGAALWVDFFLLLLRLRFFWLRFFLAVPEEAEEFEAGATSLYL